MKKLCVFYANCQADGIVHFLKKTRMAEEYDFAIHHNWQILMLEQPFEALIDDLQRAHVVVYQPCNGYDRTDGRSIPGTDILLRSWPMARPRPSMDPITISFAYQFNHGFFPLLNVSPGPDGWITSALLKQRVWAPKEVAVDLRRGQEGMLMRDYNGGRLRFDCARRLIECLAEQARREEGTDIKMVPWILQNYRKHQLFLTQNHPTSSLFMELAARVFEIIYADRPRLCADNYNEVGMNGAMPVHQSVVDELGLEYGADDKAHEYYRDLLERMMK